MRRSCLLAVSAGILFGCGFLQGEAVETSLPPDYQKLAADFRGGGLSQVRNSLGDALASEWRPCRAGFPGSCSLRNFAGWVDLYQWLDLLESDEAAVTKRWLSRHISMSLEKRPKGENVKATILQPGSPLVCRYDDLQHRGTEQLARDPATLGRVMDELVAPAFVSRNGPLLGRLDPGFVAATAADSGFLKQWSESFSEDDFAPKVLLNLQSIWKAHPEDWHEFLSLAIAIAVVKDQPAPDFWPHHQVSQRDIPRMEMQPDDLFAHWVRACREGKLMMDPRRLEAKELKFVIDAPVAPSEFDWVRNSRAPSRQNLRETFASVNYDRGRVTRQLFIWPWGSYRLSSIRAHGGICVDQAYYAAVWGKALGIPTIFFAGQGTAGGMPGSGGSGLPETGISPWVAMKIRTLQRARLLIPRLGLPSPTTTLK